MDVLIRLYNMVNPAADGSIISRKVTEEYLQSEDYKTIIRDKISLGGKTHKDRRPPMDAPIGPDDEVLVKKNSLFYISKIFTKPDSDFCWAVITIYDPDDFSGELRDEIINLRGMLKAGTKLPCSVVIQAVWSPTNNCEKIIRIKGVDFTLNPSFAGSGTERLMSSTILSEESEVRTFSNVPNCRGGVRSFCFETEVQTGTRLSRKDIISKYGLGSKEYKLYSKLEATQEAEDHKPEFLTEEFFKKAFEKYQEEEQEKTFSLSTSIEDRFKLWSYPRLIQIRLLIKLYKNLVNEKAGSLTSRDKEMIEDLYTQDLLLLIKRANSFVKEGINISSYYQLAQYNPEMSNLGRSLSFYYRRVLISEKILGYIPKNLLIQWQRATEDFIVAIMNFTWGSRLTEKPLKIIT